MSSLDDTFNPATLARSDTVASNATISKGGQSSSTKPARQTQSYPRIDLEPLYAELKSLITDNWGTYYESLNLFIRGELNANEFADRCDHFLLISTATEHAHNTLICAILLNIGRDPPEPGTAAWVSAAGDKSGGASASKPAVTSDKNESRLKAEIMALPPRERRRLKAILSDGKGALGAGAAVVSEEESMVSLRASLEQYHNASRIKAPQVPTAAAAGTKTNWDLEIRKRYTQPLYAETREFPDTNAVFARIVPICYEESIPAGTNMECAELTTIAAETFLKNFIHEIVQKVRVNGPRYENGAGTGVLTASFMRKLHKEEADVKAGRLQRDRDNDLLPVESSEAQIRRPLGIGDLKLANRVGPSLWNGMSMIGAQVNHNPFDIDVEEFYALREREGFGSFSSQINGTSSSSTHAQTNGSSQAQANGGGGDEMDVDEDFGWEGTTSNDRAQLKNVLGDLLAAPG